MLYTDPVALYSEVADDVEYETLQILRKCQFTGGQFLERFERCLATYLGTLAAVGVSSGQDALMLVLEALKIGSGDSVIIPNNINIGAAFAISRVGAKPLITDINPYTYLIDYDRVEGLLKNKDRKTKIKAIIVPHTFGQMPNMEQFKALARKHKVFLIEDASHGMASSFNYQSPGFYSDVVVASVGPTMNLWSVGQAGIVTTNSVELAEQVRVKANQGCAKNDQHTALGGSYRMDALHAATLYHTLTKLEDWTERRRKVARYYNEIFAADQRPTQQPNGRHVYHQYVFCCKSAEERDRLEKMLKANEIGYGIPTPTLISDSPMYMQVGIETPVAYDLKDRLISLPNHPSLEGTQALSVVRVVQSVCSQ